MKKLLGLCLLMSVSGFANSLEIERNINTRLCNSWRYDYVTKNYVCGWLSSYLRLVTEDRLLEEVGMLEKRVEELERKLEALEGK